MNLRCFRLQINAGFSGLRFVAECTAIGSGFAHSHGCTQLLSLLRVVGDRIDRLFLQALPWLSSRISPGIPIPRPGAAGRLSPTGNRPTAMSPPWINISSSACDHRREGAAGRQSGRLAAHHAQSRLQRRQAGAPGGCIVLLRKYQSWLTTSVKATEEADVQPLDVKPIWY